jgi:mannose-6-phosphate isomerase-like protein (cupin superfamily)
MIVTVNDAALQNQDAEQGWSISEFRLPLSGPGFSVFHGRFRAGSRHSVHRHLACDELCVYLTGRGLVGTGDDRYSVGAGDGRLMPAGVPHYFHNSGTEGVAEVLGLYAGAETVAETQYELVGPVTQSDLDSSERGGAGAAYPITRAGSGELLSAEPWQNTECRQLVATSTASCFSAVVAPGGGFTGRRNAYTVYFVWQGFCRVDGQSARAGDIWCVPPGIDTTLENASGDADLIIYGFLIRSPCRSPTSREESR